MHIDRIVIKGWRGFTFDIDFHNGMNVLIGMNGCGKTTILDLISGLTGPARSAELLTGSFEFIRLDVRWKASQLVTRQESIVLRETFDINEIARFKLKLPARTSYVLRHDLGDIRYLGEIADRKFNIDETLRSLDRWGLGVKEQLQVRPDRADYMLSDSGAQRYLLTVGMRLPEVGVPMLVDMPERSLHVMIRRNIHDFYSRFEDQQVIYATHCPEVVSSASPHDFGDWHNQTAEERPKSRFLIDLHAKENKTLREDYDQA